MFGLSKPKKSQPKIESFQQSSALALTDMLIGIARSANITPESIAQRMVESSQNKRFTLELLIEMEKIKERLMKEHERDYGHRH